MNVRTLIGLLKQLSQDAEVQVCIEESGPYNDGWYSNVVDVWADSKKIVLYTSASDRYMHLGASACFFPGGTYPSVEITEIRSGLTSQPTIKRTLYPNLHPEKSQQELYPNLYKDEDQDDY